MTSLEIQPVLVIHGGAGVGPKDRMTPEREAAFRAALTTVLEAGHRLLSRGAPALDVVEEAVRLMEDDPLFNSGRGGALTSRGTVEHDAAIMCGETRKAGALAGTQRIRNPIAAARAIMERTPHVMMIGEGAELIAAEAGLALMEADYFRTPERLAALNRILQAQAGKADIVITEQDRHGTVGAVALDMQGHLAAATSTGGRTNKLPGRVGDSPLIGAGTYADNRSVAVSCTGAGETFMRTVLAHRLAARVELLGEALDVACRDCMEELIGLGGSGGLIAVDRRGTICTPFSGAGMHRGMVAMDGLPKAAIFADEGFSADIDQWPSTLIKNRI